MPTSAAALARLCGWLPTSRYTRWPVLLACGAGRGGRVGGDLGSGGLHLAAARLHSTPARLAPGPLTIAQAAGGSLRPSRRALLAAAGCPRQPSARARRAHLLQQRVDARAEAVGVRQVAGPKVGAEGLVDEVIVQVVDGVGGGNVAGDGRQRLLQALEVEEAGHHLRRPPQLVRRRRHCGCCSRCWLRRGCCPFSFPRCLRRGAAVRAGRGGGLRGPAQARAGCMRGAACGHAAARAPPLQELACPTPNGSEASQGAAGGRSQAQGGPAPSPPAGPAIQICAPYQLYGGAPGQRALDARPALPATPRPSQDQQGGGARPPKDRATTPGPQAPASHCWARNAQPIGPSARRVGSPGPPGPTLPLQLQMRHSLAAPQRPRCVGRLSRASGRQQRVAHGVKLHLLLIGGVGARWGGKRWPREKKREDGVCARRPLASAHPTRPAINREPSGQSRHARQGRGRPAPAHQHVDLQQPSQRPPGSRLTFSSGPALACLALGSR